MKAKKLDGLKASQDNTAAKGAPSGELSDVSRFELSEPASYRTERDSAGSQKQLH
jgi:hypothetical protein